MKKSKKNKSNLINHYLCGVKKKSDINDKSDYGDKISKNISNNMSKIR